MVLGEELVFLEVSRLAPLHILSVLSQLASATFDAKVRFELALPQGHFSSFFLNHTKLEGGLVSSVLPVTGMHISECQVY